MKFKPPPPPAGCADVETHERKLTELADELEAKARSLWADGSGRIGVSAAKECALAAIRARKQAGEFARHRERVARVDHLLEQRARMRNIGTSATAARPRLVRRSEGDN